MFVCRVAGLRTGLWLVRSPGWLILFRRIDDSHCDRIYSSLTAVRCFDNGFVGKQPVTWKEYCAEYWLQELQESMNRNTGRRDIIEILLNGVKHHTINKLSVCLLSLVQGPYMDSVNQDQTARSMQADLDLHCPVSRYFPPKITFE